MNYPFDVEALRQELCDFRTFTLREERALIEKQIGIPFGSIVTIESGDLAPENFIFRDYVAYLKDSNIPPISYEFSPNFYRYLEWEDNGWAIPKSHFEFAIKVLENEISNMESYGGTGQNFKKAHEELETAVSVLRRTADEWS